MNFNQVLHKLMESPTINGVFQFEKWCETQKPKRWVNDPKSLSDWIKEENITDDKIKAEVKDWVEEFIMQKKK